MKRPSVVLTVFVLGFGAILILLWLTPSQAAAAKDRLSITTINAVESSQRGEGQVAHPADLLPRDTMTQTRWISLDGREPMTFAEWQAQQPPPPLLRIERMYASSIVRTGVLSDPIVCVLVNPAVYDGIATSLAQWIADVEAEGRTVIVDSASFPNPPALRDHLAGIPNLDGCLLVGDFPVPWVELNDSEYPVDVYYMDLDGVWVDADLDGMYDDHVGATGPEIWLGRLQAGNLDFAGDEVALLNSYFAKNHAYRTGNLILPSRALVYVDNDWANNADNLGQQMEVLYPDTTVISDLNATTALDYGQRLTEYYAWIHVFAHSTAFQHNFSYSEGEGPLSIYNLDVLNIDPRTFFYNLFACGAARFVERNYLSGWYVFGDTYGLLTIGTTTSGSMVRGFDLFHEPLAEGQSVGGAFRGWFAVEGTADPAWHYGLTLHGDPTLSVVTDEQVGEAPAGVSIAGPTEGGVGMAVNLTGTVDPGTATQPLRYTWQATGLAPVARHAGLEDVASFTWWNTPGPKTVTVTATNMSGSVANTHALNVMAPEMGVAPAAYHETLAWGEVRTRSLLLSNTGQGGLVFELAEADRVPLASSAPDPFGYTFLDSNEAGGPSYEWIEIAPPAGGSGTYVDLPTVWQGGYAWPIPLPFTFPFYGKAYDKLAIGSRGTLSFVDRSIGRDNDPVPSVRTFEVETFIAPIWDFLVIDPGAVYYQDLGDKFVVEYYRVSRYGGSDGTFEVILYDNGNVLFQYQDVYFGQSWGDQGGSATVGIQGDALTGLQYSFYTAALSNGQAICFAYPGQLPDCSAYEDVSWLSEAPGAGVVETSGAQAVDLVFDAGAPEVTGPGDYATMLVIASNDPDEALTFVPVTMTVEPDPNMGQLQGAVTSDFPGGPLAGVLVEVLSGTNVVVSGVTDASGTYGPWWLMDGAYSVRVSAEGYLDDVHSAEVSAGSTTIHDVILIKRERSIDVRVASSSDDAEEFPKGYVHRTSPDLELIWDDRLQTVGLRFAGVDVPQGATIVGAYVQFQADEADSDAASLLIAGEAVDDAATFASDTWNISSRARTGASVTWEPAPWTTVGDAGPGQRTADLAPVIQEIVSRPGWAPGNALALIISGRDTRKRVAESYEGSQAGAPLLHVEYEVGPPRNQAPSVDAGPDQTIVLPCEATLDGTVSDDGLPDPPGAVTIEWGQESGPGTVTFADLSVEDTSATFSAAGEYVLRLTAGDGELTAQDKVTVTVEPEPENQAPSVDAGDNQTVVLPGEATLDGTVTDDGLPDPPGTVTIEWSQASGPGTATFGDANAEDTTASFSEAGEYVLRLTADDGELTASGKVTITVQVEPENQPPTVGAGADQTVVLPGEAALNGMVSDDGLPDPPGAVTVEWSQARGPGTVTFADAGTEDTTASFSEAGEYVLCLTADDGELSASDEVTIIVQEGSATTVVKVRVAANSDDAEEFPSGYVHRTSPDLELIWDDRLQTVGLRFAGVEIPQGATIASAYVQFQADETDSEAASLLIEGEAADDALTFASVSKNITSRLRTGASVTWDPAPWTTVGEAGPDQRTADLAPVIQEIVNRPGWASGNALALIVSGRDTCKRVAESYEGIQAGAPLLYVEYAVGPPVNQAPSVDAGPNQAVVVTDDATLDGTVSDDGLPDPPGAVAVEWSRVSGPGTAIFADPNAEDTMVSFSEVGEYVLRLTADDSELMAQDEMTITVQAELVNGPPTVDAGDNQTVVLPGKATLDGTVTDDGLPDPPGAVTVEWSKMSGPGTVTFADASAEDTTASFSEAGEYVLRLAANDGELAANDEVTITVQEAGQTVTIEVQVSARSDDAEEFPGGYVHRTSTHLDLVYDDRLQTVGVRFVGVEIPQGATIVDAYVQFQVDKASSEATSLLIEGEAVDDPSTFVSAEWNVTSRARTGASVTWGPVPWATVGEAGPNQRTSNLAPVIQEIVSRPGWTFGNALVLIVSGTGRRVAESYDGLPVAAPLLHIEYSPN